MDDATLWKLLDRELPPAEAEALEARIAGDPALRARLEELRALEEGVLAGAPEPPAGFADRVVARALQAGTAPAPVLDLEEARRFLRRMLVAAAVLAALGLAYLAAEVMPVLIDRPVHAAPLFPQEK